MSDDLTKLRQEFAEFKHATTREFDKQEKRIKELEKDLEEKNSKLIQYVNNLMKKADTLITNKWTALRRTQVIDRQKLNQLENEIGYLSRNNKK